MKKNKLIFLILGVCITVSAQQSKKMTKKFFPDPQVEINTPSFKKRGFVNCKEMIQYIQQSIEGKNFITLDYIGKTQSGIEIPVVVFNKPTRMLKAKILLTGRVHGDEPGGTEALLYLIDQLINDPSLSPLLDKLDIAIIPMVNIDGGKHLDRFTNNGLDLNRDMTKLATPEALALWTFFNKFTPDVVLDLHEYNPFRADYQKFGRFGVTAPADVMFLYSENPNLSKPILTMMTDTYLPALQKVMTDNNMIYSKYFTSNTIDGEIVLNMGGASPRSTANAFGLSNTISLLLEVRGAGMGKTEFKRRVYASFLIASNMLKITAEKVSDVKQVLADTNRNENDIVVTQKSKEEIRNIPFIDIQKNAIIEVELPVRDASMRENNLVRKRPYAYAVLPGQEKVIQKLEQLGIRLEQLTEDKVMDAEEYQIVSYRNGDEEFEGFYEQIVKTKVHTKKITFQKGTYLVNMNQPKANLVAVVLEPEAENGFVRYHVLPTEVDAELPVYRIMTIKE